MINKNKIKEDLYYAQACYISGKRNYDQYLDTNEVSFLRKSANDINQCCEFLIKDLLRLEEIKVKKTYDISFLINCLKNTDFIGNIKENAEELSDWHSLVSYGGVTPDEEVIIEMLNTDTINKIINYIEEKIS